MLHITPHTLTDSETTLRPLTDDEIESVAGGITYDQAYYDFQQGGGHLGLGAAMLVSSAYTGIALTPALVLNSLGVGGLIGGLGGIGGIGGSIGV